MTKGQRVLVRKDTYDDQYPHPQLLLGTAATWSASMEVRRLRMTVISMIFLPES